MSLGHRGYVNLPPVSNYAIPQNNNLKLIMTHHQAGQRSRELGWSAIIGIFLLTIFITVTGILHIHYEHGYAGALFTASLIGVLMLINVLGYFIVAYFAGVMEYNKYGTAVHAGEKDKLLVDDDHEQ